MTFFAVFRLVAWKFQEHSKRAGKLGPEYFCPRCVLPQKDFSAQPYSCPKCRLTDSYVVMIEGVHSREGFPTTKGVLDEVYLRYTQKKKHWPFEWSLAYVLTVFYKVLKRLADNNYLINEEWDETTAELCRIINSERNQAQFAASWKPDAK